MHCELWTLLVRFQIKFNYSSAEGDKPRPMLVLRIAHSENAWRAVQAVGAGRLERGSAVFEGAAIHPALVWMGCQDDELLEYATQIADATDGITPVRELSAIIVAFERRLAALLVS